MSYLVSLYSIACAQQDRSEDFVTACLVELMNQDRAARAAVLEAFGVAELVDCDVIAQQPLYGEGGDYIGKADIYIQPRGEGAAAVIEAKITAPFVEHQVEKYRDALNVRRVRFLAPKETVIGPNRWRRRTVRWSKIHNRLSREVLEGRALPVTTAFLALLDHVGVRKGRSMVGRLPLKKLPLARLRSAAVLVGTANRALEFAVRGLMPTGLDEDEQSFWDDGLLDWAWSVSPNSEELGLGLAVERGQAEGLLTWKLYLLGIEGQDGWEDYGEGWWVTELSVPAGRREDFTVPLARALARVRTIVARAIPEGLDLGNEENPPALVSCADVAEGLGRIGEGERVLEQHARAWRTDLLRRLASDGRLGTWHEVRGHGDAPRLVQGGWYLYLDVDWGRTTPRWRLRIWRRHMGHVESLAAALRGTDLGSWKLEHDRRRLILSAKVCPTKPSALFEAAQASLFDALSDVLGEDGLV